MRRNLELSFILGLAAVLAFCSMGYELLIVRYLISLSNNTVLAQSLTVGCFLGALGLGAFAASKFKRREAWGLLSDVEAVISIIAAIALPVLALVTIYSSSSRMLYLAQIATLLIGFLSGLELPILISLASRMSPRAFGFVLTANYLGALAASLSIPKILLPAVGLYTTCWLLALFSAFAAALALLRANPLRPSVRWLFVPLAIALPQYASIHRDELEQFYLKSYYYIAPADFRLGALSETVELHKTYPRIKRISSPYQDIDIVPVDLHMMGLGDTADFNLFLDQKNQFGSAKAAIYHDTVVHGAINLAKHIPRTALVIGGGDGLIVRELVKYPEVESITVVELDPQVIALAKTLPLLALNENAFANPKVHVEVADGFAWLQRSDRKFDGIFIDLPHPSSLDVSRLYTVEFYRFVRRALRSDGFMVFDFPFYQLQDSEKGHKAIATIASTVQAAGFQSKRAFGHWESFMIATPLAATLEFDYPALDTRVADMSASNMALLELPDEVGTPNTLFRPSLLGWKD